jgi:ABC-type amino acid transport substrate-binding protein
MMVISNKHVVFFFVVLMGVFIGCASSQKETPLSETIPPSENLLRVGVSTNAPPLIFKQGQEIIGLEADFAREFARSLGKSLRFVELKWGDQIPALLDNRIDIIMSGMTITELRKVRIAFSESYFRGGQMALIRNEDAKRFSAWFYSIVKPERIGFVKDTTGEYFVERNIFRTKKFGFSTSKQGAKALIDKKIDLLIHDAPMILYIASEYESKGLAPVYSLLTEEYYAWGIRKQDTELLQAANTFLENLNTEGRLKAMILRWIPLAKRSQKETK